MNILRIGMIGSLSAAIGAGGGHAGVMLGAYIGGAEDLTYKADITAFEASIGRKLAIDSDYANWKQFPNVERLRWDVQTGHLPMESWRVEFSELDPNSCATGAAISAGTYDTQLAKQAAMIKSIGKTVLVRFNYEMTGNVENTCFTGFPVANNIPLAGQIFISAWRHVVDRFRSAGATNVQWVWAPGASTWIQNIGQYFYPGPAYVDWVAIDDYNKIDTPVSFATDPGIPQFAAAAPALGKPMMISENAALEDPAMNPDPQTLWVETARSYIKTQPQISAYVYWDRPSLDGIPPPPYAGTGYPLSGNGLAAFRALANDPYFGDLPGKK